MDFINWNSSSGSFFFMLYNGAGLVGVIPETLPFKVIGISYLISKVLDQ